MERGSPAGANGGDAAAGGSGARAADDGCRNARGRGRGRAKAKASADAAPGGGCRFLVPASQALAPPQPHSENLSWRLRRPRANKEQTLEFEEKRKFAGPGLDVPDFLLGPRGVVRSTASSRFTKRRTRPARHPPSAALGSGPQASRALGWWCPANCVLRPVDLEEAVHYRALAIREVYLIPGGSCFVPFLFQEGLCGPRGPFGVDGGPEGSSWNRNGTNQDPPGIR